MADWEQIREWSGVAAAAVWAAKWLFWILVRVFNLGRLFERVRERLAKSE